MIVYIYIYIYIDYLDDAGLKRPKERRALVTGGQRAAHRALPGDRNHIGLG